MAKQNIRQPFALRYTFKDFERDFPTDEACLRWLLDYLYPKGIYCKKCKKLTRHHLLPSRIKAVSCEICGAHIHPTAGTIFHKSSTSMRTWFHAIYLMSTTRCGISAMQLMRETGVTYKTAWRMFTQIRKLLAEDIRDLKGEVEADETYIGGKRRGDMSKRHKKVVGGAVERKGRVVAYHLPDNKLATIIKPLSERVLPATVIFTDEASQYGELKWLGRGYQHKRINHLAKIYVDGDVHTQTIEGFWSLLKRGISGVYHAVSAKHLQKYLDEYAFRYNHRNDPQPMFKTLLSQNASEVAASNQPRLDEQKPS